MRDIRCDLQARAELLEQQISDENAQFERALLQLRTTPDSLQHLRAQLRLANKLLEFTAWHDNLRADLAARIAVAEAAEISIRYRCRRPLSCGAPRIALLFRGGTKGRCCAVHVHAPHAVSIRKPRWRKAPTLILEMIDDQIVVTMPGTDFLASIASGRALPSSSHIPARRLARSPAPRGIVARSCDCACQSEKSAGSRQRAGRATRMIAGDPACLEARATASPAAESRPDLASTLARRVQQKC